MTIWSAGSCKFMVKILLLLFWYSNNCSKALCRIFGVSRLSRFHYAKGPLIYYILTIITFLSLSIVHAAAPNSRMLWSQFHMQKTISTPYPTFVCKLKLPLAGYGYGPFLFSLKKSFQINQVLKYKKEVSRNPAYLSASVSINQNIKRIWKD